MASRSLSVSRHSIVQIKDTVAKRGLTQKQLASEIGASRSSVIKFLSGQRVDRRIFIRCCTALEIDWEKVCDTDDSAIRNNPDSTTDVENLDDLVKDVRNKVSADISARCGTMRVLDMEQPIGLGAIYTSVNILEKLLGRRRLSLNKLLEEYDIENFDRFTLGQILQRRVPGLEAVEQYDKIMILGKPGAGKTTFLKRLATLCNQGKFQTERVPVFVTLKEFAEDKGQPELCAYIGQQWQQCGVDNDDATKKVLSQGRALILLDGLDEVQARDHKRVLEDIKTFSHKFRSCQFVMTSRIAAREYTFEQFTEVEVADFDDKQIAEFSKKWFSAKRDPKKSKTFIQQLGNNDPIKELATNPLLLTLLCLVFGEAADFPANRSELYKEGLDVLLKKWDAKRNIERDQVYKKLSLKRKEDLLSQLAFYTFDRGEYFFKQSIVEQQIFDYIRNLPGAEDDEEALQLDSADVLASIEAQHGLLIERARGIYSFSHLTFQEYFTAKQITRPTAELYGELEKLSKHITEKHYREIFLLAVGMLPEADSFLKLMKNKIDELLTKQPKLLKIFDWINRKVNSENFPYKRSSIQAIYFAQIFEPNLASSFNINVESDPESKSKYYLTLAFDIDPSVSRGFDHTMGSGKDVLDLYLRLDLYLLSVLHYACSPSGLTKNVYESLNIVIPCINAILRLNNTFNCKIKQLKEELNSLQDNLPHPKNHNSSKEWFKKHGKQWKDQLRLVMMKYRDIGHDWELTNEHTKILNDYYKACRLLLDCLNSDCYVTKATRQDIEDTLLLPISEIEKRKVQ